MYIDAEEGVINTHNNPVEKISPCTTIGENFGFYLTIGSKDIFIKRKTLQEATNARNTFITAYNKEVTREYLTPEVKNILLSRGIISNIPILS